MNKLLPEWIIFHVPHTSTHIPEQVRDQFILSDSQLAEELLKMTDHHTLDLFAEDVNPSQVVCSPVSRLVVDVERFDDDHKETMAAIGMGAIYTHAHDLSPLRRTMTLSQRQALLDKWYYPHHRALTEAVNNRLEKYNRCLVLDCHSFPSIALPYEKQFFADRTQICIGTDPYHTPRALALYMLNGFSQHGFTVNENAPFSGALVPMAHYQNDNRVSALMIEVRRDLYMDESTGEKSCEFQEIRATIKARLNNVSDAY